MGRAHALPLCLPPHSRASAGPLILVSPQPRFVCGRHLRVSCLHRGIAWIYWLDLEKIAAVLPRREECLRNVAWVASSATGQTSLTAFPSPPPPSCSCRRIIGVIAFALRRFRGRQFDQANACFSRPGGLDLRLPGRW